MERIDLNDSSNYATLYVRNLLFERQDNKYRDFISKLVPNLSKENIIGIKSPVLRNIAKELWNESRKTALDFLEELPHKYLEENNLHAFIIEQIKDYDVTLNLTEKFLPYIDNWATCDSFSPKIFAKNLDKLYSKSLSWINSNETYTTRFGIGMLMEYFLSDKFKPEMLDIVGKVSSEEYYINMMRAWYFATALAKQHSLTIAYMANKTLDIWTHNKAIQKGIESRRLSEEQKEALRKLKRRFNK